MRYRLPEGCGAVSIDGKQVAPARDGTVELDIGAAAALLPHGIEPVEATPDRAQPERPGAAVPDKRPER